jgi:hypothetical protein
VEPLWGLPAWFWQMRPQKAPRRLCGATLGPPGWGPSQGGPNAAQKALWRLFVASIHGLNLKDILMVPRLLSGVCWEPPGSVPAPNVLWITRAYFEHLRKRFGMLCKQDNSLPIRFGDLMTVTHGLCEANECGGYVGALIQFGC